MKKLLLVLTSLFGSAAMAAELVISKPGAEQMFVNPAAGQLGMAAALAIAVAAVGGAMAQGKAAAVALEGIARNPAASDKLFTPMIIALALIESLVIYAFVIAFLIKP
jgi:F-type H+-transporting ATPase subunit c